MKLTPDERLCRLLDTGDVLTYARIQQSLNIGERQVRRVIQRLRDGGLPIQERRDGALKLFSLPADRQRVAVPDLQFDGAELRALAVAAKASRSVLAGTPHAEPLGRAFEKLLDRARPVAYVFDPDEPMQEWHFDDNVPDAISMECFRQLEAAMNDHRSEPGLQGGKPAFPRPTPGVPQQQGR